MLSFDPNASATPIELVKRQNFDSWLSAQTDSIKNQVARANFKASANRFIEVADSNGKLVRIVAGVGSTPSHESISTLPRTLPAGSYHLEDTRELPTYELSLGWGLGSYRFNTYKTNVGEQANRTLHVDPEQHSVQDEIDAIFLVRDLINTPTSDMLPQHLELAVRGVANKHGAELDVTIDNELLKKGYRTIYTVGQASTSEPRLLDLRWGNPDHKKLTIIGKGVCFDSGGLNLKPGASMRHMKKDMGGAATALGLADLIMKRNLPVRLRLLIPAVENAVSGNAYRPGDIIRTYKGLTVEIGNTDAEGRLIMCDALALAVEEDPALIVDYATLTGAARSAVGTEIAAMFSNDDEIANHIAASGDNLLDPVWRLPLHQSYRQGLRSTVADIGNIATFNEGGAIVAALYLEYFIEGLPWVHFDINGYNARSRPAHPQGGEAMGLRATADYIQNHFVR